MPSFFLLIHVDTRSFSLRKLMENNAVCLINLKFFAVHDHIIVFVVHTEEGHCVRLMIQAHQMPVIWKQRRIFGLLSARRQIKQTRQLACLLVNLKQ